jgi:hypothetical protein
MRCSVVASSSRSQKYNGRIVDIMDKALSTGFFFLIITFLVYLSVTFDPGRKEALTMDEAIPTNSIISVKENKIEGSPPEDMEDIPVVVVGNIPGKFILRESVPDPLPATEGPLPPPEEVPTVTPSTTVVIVVPEEPVVIDPTT